MSVRRAWRDGEHTSATREAYPEAMGKVRSVSATRVINASAAVIFDLLASPSQHPRLDGSSTVVKARHAPERLYLGATFSMDMKAGLPYVTRNKVVAFEEFRCIAWHHFSQFVWRYDLEEVPGGTRVTESFDFDRPWGFAISLFGIAEKNRVSMDKTLERLEAIVTS
jgi:hypothetical protein